MIRRLTTLKENRRMRNKERRSIKGLLVFDVNNQRRKATDKKERQGDLQVCTDHLVGAPVKNQHQSSRRRTSRAAPR